MFKHKKLDPYTVTNVYTTEQLYAVVGQVMDLYGTALSMLDQVLMKQEAILVHKRAAR